METLRKQDDVAIEFGYVSIMVVWSKFSRKVGCWQVGKRKQWDRQMKWIFNIAPEDLVAWIFNGEAEFIDLANTELDGEELFSDMLCYVKILGQKSLLHIEFQKRRDSKMAERLWVYNVRATIKHK